LLKPLVKGLATTLVFFLVAEIALRVTYSVRNAMVRYVPLPYAFGDDYGPTPPWLDRLLILKSDPVLVWRSAPNVERTYLDVFSPVHVEADRVRLLRRFWPTIPAEFRANPTWRIHLNSEGYRGDEFPPAPPPGTLRIACVGDSWTFGMPANQNETYPARLAAWLEREMPGRRFEIENFGVLGYSSYQGLQVFKARVLQSKPDIVAIGFGMNDSEVAGYRDKDMAADDTPPPFGARLKGALKSVVEASESYKLLDYFALVVRFRPKPIDAYLKDQAEAKGSTGPVDYDAIEPWTRVSPRDYEANLREMAALARARGAKVVLVDNELWEGSPYRPVLKRLSAELGAPLVDSLALVTSARDEIERNLERTLGLAPATPVPASAAGASETTRVIFRVWRGNYEVPRALSIVGSDPQLGSLSPNTILMHDDGKDGDEKAGDGVWSYSAALPRDKTISYVYTNSGRRGEWEGLDVPHIRTAAVPPFPAGTPAYLPIETFGRVYMQGDDWHTNAAGYDLIGRGVAQAVERLIQ
jgi:lysophospholipase L1-like esterase